MQTHPQPQHHVWFSDLSQHRANDNIELIGPEAHHAIRVKRINNNDPVAVQDGCGRIAIGHIRQIAGSKSKPTLTIALDRIDSYPPITPRVEVFAALPKGDHLDRMIDQLSQLGVALVRPLICDRSQRKPDTLKPDKLARIAIESSKQCHRPWILEIADPIKFTDAILDPDALICDISAQTALAPPSNPRIVILVGPEGGWSQHERDLIVTSNVKTARFAPFVLRIESAAAAAAAIVLARASQCPGDHP